MIKRVAQELHSEFPHVKKFSTLSPIPMFRGWLIDKIKCAEKGELNVVFNCVKTTLQMSNSQNAVMLSSYNFLLIDRCCIPVVSSCSIVVLYPYFWISSLPSSSLCWRTVFSPYNMFHPISLHFQISIQKCCLFLYCD